MTTHAQHCPLARWRYERAGGARQVARWAGDVGREAGPEPLSCWPSDWEKVIISLGGVAGAEFSKAAAEIKQRARLEGPLQFAPIRSLDEFIMTKARFQAPEYNNVDKFRNRVVSKALNPHLHLLCCDIHTT